MHTRPLLTSVLSARVSAVLSAVVAAIVLAAGPAAACGDGEAPTACGDAGPEAGATWMLRHVVAAVERDKAGALEQFTKGEGGFRTADTYVFCVGPDGVMSAHPNPILQGHDVRDLHDSRGTYFIRTMMREARSGTISVIHYLFPRPGSTVAVPKTTYYTRAGDQTCAVGVYDGDEARPEAANPAARVADLRRRLDAAMPAGLRPDWQALIEALEQRREADASAIKAARQNLDAARLALPDESR